MWVPGSTAGAAPSAGAFRRFAFSVSPLVFEEAFTADRAASREVARFRVAEPDDGRVGLA